VHQVDEDIRIYDDGLRTRALRLYSPGMRTSAVPPS
jgi:hypothetical protein